MLHVQCCVCDCITDMTGLHARLVSWVSCLAMLAIDTTPEECELIRLGYQHQQSYHTISAIVHVLLGLNDTVLIGGRLLTQRLTTALHPSR